MRILALLALLGLTPYLGGCSPVPLTLNDKTIVFSYIDTVQVDAADSVLYSKGAFVVKSSTPVIVNGRKVTVLGDEVSVGGNRFEVGADYQVRVQRDGSIYLEWIQPTPAGSAPDAESGSKPAS